MKRARWQDWPVLVAGLILMMVPFAFSYKLPVGVSQAYVTTAFIGTGVVALIWGSVGGLTDRNWQEWITMALGAWLIAMPWILGVQGLPGLMWSSVVTGIVILALTFLSRRDIKDTSRV